MALSPRSVTFYLLIKDQPSTWLWADIGTKCKWPWHPWSEPAITCVHWQWRLMSV